MLLIDGYNLLQVTALFGSADGPPTLERARTALLDYLVHVLEPKQLARTIVVFDAVNAPPGLARERSHGGLTVRFARRGGTADELLEELILNLIDPRHALVVSSDHRVQRAARQRGAPYTDSEPWFNELTRQARTHPGESDGSAAAEKETAGLENPFPPNYASDVVHDADSAD